MSLRPDLIGPVPQASAQVAQKEPPRYPTLFGKGLMEKDQRWYPASGLLHGQTHLFPTFAFLNLIKQAARLCHIFANSAL